MNEPSLPTQPNRGRLRAIARRIPVVAAVVVTAGALVWTEENWRAARDWASCQQDMASRGEGLDLAAAYDPLPPERNLAQAPLFTRGFQYSVDAASGLVTFPQDAWYRLPQLDHMPSPREERTAGGGSSSGPSSVFLGERSNLRAWQANYRQHPDEFPLPPVAVGAALPAPAEDVLRALESFSPVLDDVERAATTMPTGVFSRAAASFNGGLSVAIRRIVQTLALRADAHLAAGQSAEARHDLELIFWLRQATTTEPRSFLNVALGCSHVGQLLQPVWEGLADRRWTADDLAAIQRRLQSVDLLADYRRGASGERASFLFLIDGLLDGRYKDTDLFGRGDGWRARVPAWLLMHGPGGWLIQNKVGTVRFYQDYLLDCVDVPAHRFRPERLSMDTVLTRMATTPVWPWQYLLVTGVPGFLRVGERAALVQTALDEAVVACALERHALAHGGAYPADLDALVPATLDHVPNSVVDGTPLRYALTPEGRYRLSTPLPLRATENPPGSMVRGDEVIWGYPSDH